jgi:hypothetical protein
MSIQHTGYKPMQLPANAAVVTTPVQSTSTGSYAALKLSQAAAKAPTNKYTILGDRQPVSYAQTKKEALSTANMYKQLIGDMRSEVQVVLTSDNSQVLASWYRNIFGWHVARKA